MCPLGVRERVQKNPPPTHQFAAIKQKAHKTVAEALALQHAGAPALPAGGAVQRSPSWSTLRPEALQTLKQQRFFQATYVSSKAL